MEMGFYLEHFTPKIQMCFCCKIILIHTPYSMLEYLHCCVKAISSLHCCITDMILIFSNSLRLMQADHNGALLIGPKASCISKFSDNHF